MQLTPVATSDNIPYFLGCCESLTIWESLNDATALMFVVATSHHMLKEVVVVVVALCARLIIKHKDSTDGIVTSRYNNKWGHSVFCYQSLLVEIWLSLLLLLFPLGATNDHAGGLF